MSSDETEVTPEATTGVETTEVVENVPEVDAGESKADGQTIDEYHEDVKEFGEEKALEGDKLEAAIDGIQAIDGTDAIEDSEEKGDGEATEDKVVKDGEVIKTEGEGAASDVEGDGARTEATPHELEEVAAAFDAAVENEGKEETEEVVEGDALEAVITEAEGANGNQEGGQEVEAGEPLSGSESEEEEDEIDETELIAKLEEELATKRLEEEIVKKENADYHKKIIYLLAREKAMNIQAGQGGGKGADKKDADTTTNIGDADEESEKRAEKEKIYKEALLSIVASQEKINRQSEDYDRLSHDLQTRLDDREFKATEIAESFAAFKREILGKSENTRTHQSLSNKVVKQFEKAQEKREEELERVRLRYISMRTQLQRAEKALRAREQLAEGLHMIDFEQLKVENQTLYEKIEERTEELNKLKRKKTHTVQVLTHVREKLRFVEQSVVKLKKDLSVVENKSMSKRASLTQIKKERDVIREDNKELRRKQGFVSSTGLMQDYEGRGRSIGDAKAKIQELKSKYDTLMRTVEQAALMKQNAALVSRGGVPTPMMMAPPGESMPGVPQGGMDMSKPPSTGNDGDISVPLGRSSPTTPYFPGSMPGVSR